MTPSPRNSSSDSQPQDPQISRFESWLAEQTGESVSITSVSSPVGGGLSHRTQIIDLRIGKLDDRVVLRTAPTGLPLFPKYDFASQVKLLRVLAADGSIPVARVRYYESDLEIIGEEFYVMDFAAGLIPPDNPGYQFAGWVHDLVPSEQTRLLDASLTTMATINRGQANVMDIGFLDRLEYGADALDQEFGYWRNYLDWASDDDPVAIVEEAFAHCVATRPSGRAARELVWGDARLGNLVFSEDLNTRTVLDWEMAVLGPAELDLGWYFFLERTALQYTDQLPGFYDRSITTATYEQHLGRAVENLDWYEIWGGVRAACIQVRLARILGELGVVNAAEYRGRNPATRALHGLLK